MLLEKAWAKVNGGYFNIIQGNSIDVLKAFTNFATERNSFNEVDPELLWDKILAADESGYIMTTTSMRNPEALEPLGLVSEHAFSLITAKEEVISSKNVRLLKIRNPWGFREWKGRWSDKSPEWTPEAKKKFGVQKDADDGTFWMDFNDYIKYFVSVDFCFKSNICAKAIQCESNKKEIAHVYELSLSTKSMVSITAIKRYYRYNRKIASDRDARLTFNLIVLKKRGGQLDWIKGLTEYEKDPQINLEFEMGTYYIYAQANYEVNTYDKPRKWVVEVTSSNFFSFCFKDYDHDYSCMREVIDAYVRKNKNTNIGNKFAFFEKYRFPNTGYKNPTVKLGHDLKRFMGKVDVDLNISDVKSYSWVHKTFKLDMENIVDAIDHKKVMRKFIKENYPEVYKKILWKCKPLGDGIEVEFHDKYDFGNGCYYIGQWMAGNHIVRHGVGYMHWEELGTWTLGTIKFNIFVSGTRFWENGAYLEIPFQNGRENGIGKNYYIYLLIY